MTEFWAIAIVLIAIFALLGSGVWVGLSLIGVAVIALEVVAGRSASGTMFFSVWPASSSWALTALPMFVWMGEILYRTRLSQDLFRGLAPWLAKLPGGLMHTNIVGCTVFAAVSGSSAATLSTVGRMSIPELRARNYPENMIVGTLAGAATLGLMIPPSLTLIVYGVAINESIRELFIAGIVPGLVLASFFMAYVAITSKLSANWNPRPEPEMTFREKVANSGYLIPVSALIVAVIGSMFLPGGYAFEANEAAMVGVLGALALAFAQGSLTRATFTDSLMGAVRTSAMIALILAGAAFLTQAMAFTGLPRDLATWVSTLGLSRVELLLALLLFYIVLGCFLDGISSVVLTMAIVEPMIRGAGIDVIWFGIFVTVAIEMAQITPPIGFNLFVLQGITRHGMGTIARAALPMFAIMVAMALLLIAVPGIATGLPALVRSWG